MHRIIKSIGLLVGASGVIAAGVTGAFFSDIETSIGNTFTAGAIDLKIDNTSYYNGVATTTTSWSLTDLTIEKFFNFFDLKPSDWGEDTISLHVDTNDAYLCAEVTLTSDDDNTPTEPELLDDATTGVGLGELADAVNFAWWADDGDNVLEDDEEVISQGPIGALTLNQAFSIALADSDENIWTGQGGPIDGETTYYIGKAWCFGTMILAPVAPGNNSPTIDPGFDCDGSALTNEAQTDSLTADVSFEAVQARNNPSFQCEETPTFGACTPGLEFADSNGLFDQGQQKEGDPVLANRSDPMAAFGAPQTSGADSDVGFPVGSFVSLGFPDIDDTASLVLNFDNNVVVNGPGADLKIYETTGGAYPDEHVKVEAKKEAADGWTVIAADAVRDEEIDLGPLAYAKFVRITDTNNPALFPADADGYDLDAVEALNCGVLQQP